MTAPRFPVVITGWTEYEREDGWGATQRHDGISVHLTAKDALEFSRAYNAKHHPAGRAPDCYDQCDDAPEVIDADADLYEYLQAKKREGVLGVRAYREDEKLVRKGKSPWGQEVFGVVIRGVSPGGSPCVLVDKHVPGNASLKVATARVTALIGWGFDAAVSTASSPVQVIQATVVEAEVGIRKGRPKLLASP